MPVVNKVQTETVVVVYAPERKCAVQLGGSRLD
jgi:hypothetical protein